MENQLNSPNISSGIQGKDNQSYSVTPKFEFEKHNIGVEDIKTETNRLITQGNEGVTEQKNPFPVEVFPLPVQEIITHTNKYLKFPIDFIGASVLYAVSVAIGNTHRVKNMESWLESANLYIVLVGSPGTNKSHPITFAIKPIEQRDNEEFQKYQIEKREYDCNITLAKKERKQPKYNELIKPTWKQHLVTDFTPEALSEVHKFNKRGIGVYTDELLSWFNNFNRYNKGSEEQFWLSVWNSTPIRINRKTSEPILISLPFISVIGTIQPGVLNELANNRTENGFLDRLLFVAPDGLKKEYWSEKELSPEIVKNWNTIIKNLLEIPIEQDENKNPQPQILSFTHEAREHLFNWQKELTDLSNNPENEIFRGISAKIEMYAIRLALILEILRYACNESEKQEVSIEAVKGAIKLVEYFQNNAIKMHSAIFNLNPLDRLPDDKQNLYKALPDTFTTEEGLQIAKHSEITERTFKRFLNERKLFKWLGRGKYKKCV